MFERYENSDLFELSFFCILLFLFLLFLVTVVILAAAIFSKPMFFNNGKNDEKRGQRTQLV